MDDLISRAEAMRTYQNVCYGISCNECKAKEEDGTCGFEKWVRTLSTATRPVDEWCVDCSEYDTERKCCPRFNRVIRSAMTDSNTPNTLDALKALERILNYCEEIDNHLPEAERSGYKMLPDYEVVRSALTGSVTGWIPCSERLPDEDGRYLCDYGHQCVDFGVWTFGQWYVSGVVAWMPLPEPYEENKI